MAEAPFYLTTYPGAVRPAWCEVCQSESAVTVSVYTVDDKRGPAEVGEVAGCESCKTGMYGEGEGVA